MRHEFIAGNLALDFSNTVHNHGMSDPDDDLMAPSDLVEWANQAGLLRKGEIRLTEGAGDLTIRFRHALALRELLYQIFSRVAKGKKPKREAFHQFQDLYRKATRQAEFQGEANRYRLAWSATDPLERVSHQIIRSAASLLTSEALARVRQCAGENCSWLFVDTSRNRLRRWCDMRACGNRAKVERFRRRTSARHFTSRAPSKQQSASS